MMDLERFIGFDVSKELLEIAILPEKETWSSRNDEAGVEALVKRLKGLSPSLIVLEATGGLETLVLASLAAAGLSVCIINPRQVRRLPRQRRRCQKRIESMPTYQPSLARSFLHPPHCSGQRSQGGIDGMYEKVTHNP